MVGTSTIISVLNLPIEPLPSNIAKSQS